MTLQSISLKEGSNKFLIKNLVFNKKFQIIDLDYIKLDYFDEDDQKI